MLAHALEEVAQGCAQHEGESECVQRTWLHLHADCNTEIGIIRQRKGGFIELCHLGLADTPQRVRGNARIDTRRGEDLARINAARLKRGADSLDIGADGRLGRVMVCLHGRDPEFPGTFRDLSSPLVRNAEYGFHTTSSKTGPRSAGS